jgi:hypothetical protein
MRILMTVLVALSLTSPAAPSYRVARTVGDHPFLFDFRGAAQAVVTPPVDNALSAWQTLPFPFRFFGQAVEGYYISDNGYVTFDKAAKTSAAASTALGESSAPRNSIFAFWTDMRLEGGRGPWVGHVYTATLGASPNRIHAIYWMGPVPAADSFAVSSYNFLLAIHENGEFESIFASGRKATPVKATVGALSADGKTAVTAAGPGIDYPPVGYGSEDDVSYRFSPIDAAAVTLSGADTTRAWRRADSTAARAVSAQSLPGPQPPGAARPPRQ